MSVPLFAISLTADGAVSTTGTPVVADDVDAEFGTTETIAALGVVGLVTPGVIVEGTGADCSLEAVTSVNPLQMRDPVPSAAAVEIETPDTSSVAAGLPISEIIIRYQISNEIK